MTKEECKIKVIDLIEKHKDDIIKAADEIYASPEYGYREFNTSKVVQNFFSKLNLEIEKDLGITGCAVHANKGKKGPKIVVMGELDAVASPNHKDALASGEAHTCGHNHQIAGMLGASLGIINSGVLEYLDGEVSFLAVPAEEFIEIEYRDGLRKEGKIKYLSGKQHLVAEGFFDDIDMAIMFHSYDCGDSKSILKLRSNGFLGKKIEFKGVEAHAGGAPEKGVNALNAALLAMNNIHAQRETFKDEDWVRVHPIITKGGDLTNVVPADVRMESYIRANSLEAIKSANYKFDRAVKAGAMAVGAKVVITDIPGYLPIVCQDEMLELFRENLLKLGLKPEDIADNQDFTASLDVGDITHIMPAIHPMMGGIKGDLHAANFNVVDKDLAYIIPAKAMALTVIDLLFDNAKEAKTIIENFTPVLTKKEYMDYLKNADIENEYDYSEK